MRAFVIRICFVSGATLSLWACTTSSGNGVGTSQPPIIVGTGATVSQTIGADGGSVQLEGTTLSIPPGAVPPDAGPISITSTTSAPPAGVANLSPVYHFGPDGIVFAKPITVQLTFADAGQNPTVLWTNLNSNTFAFVPTTISGNTASAQVTHFSQGFVADGTTLSTIPGASDAGPADATQGGGTDATVPPSDSGTSASDGGSGPAQDASPPADDATVPPSDGGTDATVQPDSGSGGGGSDATAGDSATPPTDSGADATLPGDASGGGGFDAGASDAGTPQPDANLPPIDSGTASCNVCSSSICESACPSGTQTCNGGSTCINLQEDPSNCGTCGTVCSGSQVCSNGSCVASCRQGSSATGCGVAPFGDAAPNCGLCGGNFVACGRQCIDPTSDPNNCGGCGTACGTGEVCSNSVCAPLCNGGEYCSTSGACVPSCPSGSVSCSDAGPGATNFCTVLADDSRNCGACGHACGGNQLCVSGQCVQTCGQASGSACGPSMNGDGGMNCSSCGVTFMACGGSCTDTSSDPTNCGGCGTVCGHGQLCSSGVCTGMCPPSEVCSGGACLGSCPSGSVICSPASDGGTAMCTSTLTDSFNCGACGHTCPGGTACAAGTCQPMCGGGATDAGTAMPDAGSGGGGGGMPPGDAGPGGPMMDGGTGPQDATLMDGAFDAPPPPPQDGSVGPGKDGGGPPPPDSGPSACGTPNQIAATWQAMLSAPIVPLGSIANLNMNQMGPGQSTFSYAESVNCTPTSVPDAGASGTPGENFAYWGQNEDVQVQWNQSGPPNLYQVTVQGAYSGTMAFTIKNSQTYGTQSYTVGVGKLWRNGTPIAIDWSDAGPLANELYTGMIETFAPAYAPATNCIAVGDCLLVPDDGSNPDGGPGNAFIGIRPLKIYLQIPSGTSTPTLLYTFFDGAESPDGGVGVPGDGGVGAPPNGAVFDGNTFGSCEAPAAPLCAKHVGTSVVSCRDYPQHGYMATCL